MKFYYKILFQGASSYCYEKCDYLKTQPVGEGVTLIEITQEEYMQAVGGSEDN